MTQPQRKDITMNRIALLHTGAVVIPTFASLASDLLPGIEVQHLLDDRIVADLGRGADRGQIADRLSGLGQAAARSGASAVLLTCSSISEFAGPLADDLGIPVFRVDEAMADEAVGLGTKISVVATLGTTLRPTAGLLRERADLQGRSIDLSELVVAGAFEAAVAGDRERHDLLVADAIEQQAAVSDVVVLAQASMASAADRARVSVPVLTSPELGVRHVAAALAV
jgi:Asp/Glu/hydantoin racemase